MGSKTGLEAIEKTVIDRAVQMIYQPYFADPRPENMPVLGDLLNALMAQGIPEAERVAQALDLYVNGSLNFFNHRTTVDILLSSPEIENILENSDFIYLLNLSAGDRKLMTERLNISAEQLAYVTNADPGSGLLFFQNVILPFRDEFPKDTELYRLLTTKPSEVVLNS